MLPAPHPPLFERRCRRRTLPDPRRALGIVLALSLAGLGALPRVAEALNGALVELGGGAGCRVVEVVDGDTVTLACAGRPTERARLTGFDTP